MCVVHVVCNVHASLYISSGERVRIGVVYCIAYIIYAWLYVYIAYYYYYVRYVRMHVQYVHASVYILFDHYYITTRTADRIDHIIFVIRHVCTTQSYIYIDYIYSLAALALLAMHNSSHRTFYMCARIVA